MDQHPNSQLRVEPLTCGVRPQEPSASHALLKGRPALHSGLPHVKLLEPVGGSPPKFTLETKTLTMERVSEDPLSLSCPAQGSPVPAYRLVAFSSSFSEPIGGSAPKFTIDSKLSLVERKFAQPLTLVCPAQGSPVPGYRSLPTIE